MEADHCVLAGGIPETFCGPSAGNAPHSQKVLTQQLRELMRNGIVHREPKGAIPAPVEYSLTDYGRTVLPLGEDVRLWGRAHMERSTSQRNAATSG